MESSQLKLLKDENNILQENPTVKRGPIVSEERRKAALEENEGVWRKRKEAS